MQQQAFAGVSFERFLDEMNCVVPWAKLAAAIALVYPMAEGPGRLPVGVERMLRFNSQLTSQ